MNWWHWIVEAFGGRPSESAAPRRNGSKRGVAEASTAVATAVAAADDPASADHAGPSQCWWRPDGPALTALAGPECPELGPDGTALEHALRAQLKAGDVNLPPVPRVIERVLRLLRDPECPFEELAQTIAEDQITAGVVLRMANSPVYRGNDAVSALKPALTRLGLRATRTLMLHESLRAAMFPAGEADLALAEMLWARSLAASGIMRRLSGLTGVDTENAALIGLLHDVGNVLVLREVHRQKKVTRRHVPLEVFEHLCFRFHQELGRSVAQAWQLPQEITALIADHHRPPEPDDPQRIERWQIQLGDMIASMLGYGPDATYNLTDSDPARALGLDGHDGFHRLLDALPEDLDRNQQSASG